MEEDVTRAIKQLETIAIKAMNSGYLDDAAKVMHIAEEIERVDKSCVGADTTIGTEQEFAETAACEEPESVEQQSFDNAARNVVPLNRFKIKRSAAVCDDIPESPRQ